MLISIKIGGLFKAILFITTAFTTGLALTGMPFLVEFKDLIIQTANMSIPAPDPAKSNCYVPHSCLQHSPYHLCTTRTTSLFHPNFNNGNNPLLVSSIKCPLIRSWLYFQQYPPNNNPSNNYTLLPKTNFPCHNHSRFYLSP